MTWPTVPLGDAAAFVRGVTVKPDEVTVPVGSGAVACMRTKNVQDQLDLNDVWGIPRARVKRQDQFLRAGDILVSSANSWNLVGKCCWIPELPDPATFGGFVSVLRANPRKVVPRFLYYWFSSPEIQHIVQSFGRRTTSISNLDLGRCLDLRLPLPSLPDQHRIARVLDLTDSMRSNRRRAIHASGLMVQAVFTEMFGCSDSWVSMPLADLVADDRPITYGILKPGPHVLTGVPYVRVVDIQNGGIRAEAVRRTSPAIALQYKRSILAAGDILMSIRGHVGRLAVVPPELAGANITQDSARLAIRDCDPRFVLEAIRSPSVQAWMRRRVKGIAVQGINLADVKMIPIPAVPIGRQCEFAARASTCDRLVARTGAHLRHLDDLFSSLRHRAFTGAL